MNKWAVIIALTLVSGVILIAPVVLRKYEWIKMYSEAEPHVEIVWPLAETMKAFHVTHGKNATSLMELSTDTNVLALSRFNPVFTPSGTNIFSMMVNTRFGFQISQDYRPIWIVPE